MKLGIERACNQPELVHSWGRIAFLGNQASVTRDLKPSWLALYETPGAQLVAFFGPQHGFHATVQDNMIETAHGRGPFGMPVYSLYSETREPSASMLEEIDTIVIDLQNTGCRVYTFKYTLAACLRAARKYDKRVVVLDRPNPVGGVTVEGRVLDPDVFSFVGEFSIPMRHGLTLGEAALLFNESIGASLDIVTMTDWDPNSLWHATGLSWVLTSPNLPTAESTYIYPGTVAFEGCNVSEGRGTTLPFQLIGAPYLQDSDAYVQRVKKLAGDLPGVHLRPAEFQPTYHKWQNQTCYGVHLHLLEPHQVPTFRLGLALMRAAAEVGETAFQWKQPPYEYETEILPIRLILGGQAADEKLLAAEFSVDDEYWSSGLERYCDQASRFLQYPRTLKPRK